MLLRALVLLSALAALSACAGSAPVVEAPPPAPPPVVVRPAPRPPPPALPPVAVVPEAPPAPPAPPPSAPPSAPRGTLESRAYYEPADVSEWVLTNGATVVFKPLSNGGIVRRLDVGGCGVGQDEESSDRLSGLFDSFYGPASVYILAGDARPGEVELAAARLLALGTTVVDCLGPAFVNPSRPVALAPEDDAAVAVLVEVLRARGASTEAVTRNGQTFLVGLPLLSSRPGPTADELTAARSAAARRTDDAAFWTEALLSLYATGGDLRPSRDPAFVSRFPARVARVSASDVTRLAARFAVPFAP